MIYFLLLIIIIIYLVVLVNDKNLFSPSSIMCESYILAVLCAIINIDKWNISISVKTFQIIIIGILSFIIPSFFVLHCYFKKNDNESQKSGEYNYCINKQIYLILIILQFAALILYLYYVIKTIGGIGNVFRLSEILHDYREGTSYGDLESLVPTYVNQLVKISQVVSYVSLYNIFYEKMIKKTRNDCLFLNIVSIVLFIALSLLSGGRYKMIAFFLATLVMGYTIFKKMTNKGINIKNILKIFLLIVAIILCFSKTRTLVGRTNDDDLVSYVSSYFGGSIQLLDLYLKNPIENDGIFGKESFYALNNTLAKFGIVPKYRMHLEFRSSNGVVIGNVYTAFRCFYHDFGIIGVVILQALLAIIWTCWYKRIIKQSDMSKFDSSFIFYCMFINCLFFSSYRDNFFSSTMSVATITMVLYFVIIKKLLIKEYKVSEGENYE